MLEIVEGRPGNLRVPEALGMPGTPAESGNVWDLRIPPDP